MKGKASRKDYDMSFVSKFDGGICHLCTNPLLKGQTLRGYPPLLPSKVWVHDTCYTPQKYEPPVRKDNGYRLGKSPGSYKSKR